MLVIRRRAGESLILSGGVEIAVLELSAHGVKLGISAPADVTVLRNEVYLAQRANRQAAETAIGDRAKKLLDSFRQMSGPSQMAS